MYKNHLNTNEQIVVINKKDYEKLMRFAYAGTNEYGSLGHLPRNIARLNSHIDQEIYEERRDEILHSWNYRKKVQKFYNEALTQKNIYYRIDKREEVTYLTCSLIGLTYGTEGYPLIKVHVNVWDKDVSTVMECIAFKNKC